MKNILYTPASRRKFMVNTGRGILAATVFAPAVSRSNQFIKALGGDSNEANVSDTTPVKLPPLDAPSEKEKAGPPAPLSPDKKIGYAIVGLGHLSLENILPAFGQSRFAKPVALVSGDAGKARKVAEQYGIPSTGIYNYQNFDSIKKNKDVQAVYIVLPNSMHAEFTIRAAKAGKHVLCEKPMAVSSAEAKQMIEAMEAANKKLMIAYRIQYELLNKQIKDWVRSEKFGKTRVIEMFNAQNIGDPAQWRLHKALSGGGSLPDIGLYCLNTARYLTGEEPEWVNATSYSTPNDPRFREVEETVLFQLRFPSGTLVNAGCSYGVHESRRYRCMADTGAWFGMDPAFPYKGLKIEADEIRDKKEYTETPQIEFKDQFALELDHFADCIMHDKKPYTPGEEGLQDHVLMEAIYTSAKEGKAIKLDTVQGRDRFRNV